MNQKLSNWASIAEILSGIAVVISLILLLFEVRGNSEAVRAATFQNVSDSITQMADFAHDKELVDLYFRGLQGALDDPLEGRQFGLILGVGKTPTIRKILCTQKFGRECKVRLTVPFLPKALASGGMTFDGALHSVQDFRSWLISCVRTQACFENVRVGFKPIRVF